MKIVIAPDRAELGHFTAQRAAETLRDALASRDECNLVIATGSSQFEVLDSLTQQPDIDWSRVNGFHLDEYLGIGRDHAASFSGYLASRFVDRLPLKSFYYLDGLLPPETLQANAEQMLQGRQIDLLLCGIGENGHLAFNDPPADFSAKACYHLVDLDEACRRQQVGEGWFDSLESVPTRAISMTVSQILRADKIYCSVPDRRKAEAVKASIESEISPNCPATALRQHQDVTLVLDEPSASLLSDDVRAGCRHTDAPLA
ncbi:glucosamine-6-phosphate deaminase [Aureliella helgolandensis]|uniref:Glucosamine-6-phosphate deaminase 1 n=1 Tax=Aureliella helgolandensis TaxID=2527968 RepID=A0A518GEI7_9BACT|nr:glucosamine-6-phosphate deaminase [Aureliella helgolandensis]QDV27011.1 Glucosamine-6-phosphate deaminase 1 [Aureliella helgolandensis]